MKTNGNPAAETIKDKIKHHFYLCKNSRKKPRAADIKRAPRGKRRHPLRGPHGTSPLTREANGENAISNINGKNEVRNIKG